MKSNVRTTWQSGNDYDYYHDRSGHARRSDHAVNGDDKTVQVSRWNFKDSELIGEKKNRRSLTTIGRDRLSAWATARITESS